MGETNNSRLWLRLFCIVSGGVFSLLGTWLLAYGFTRAGFEDWNQWRHLRQSGIPAGAIVLEVDQGMSSGRGVRYRYETTNEYGLHEPFETWEKVNSRIRSQVEVGETVSILYDPEDPSISRIEGNYQYVILVGALPLTCLLIPLTVVILVGPIYILYLYKRRKVDIYRAVATYLEVIGRSWK
jgi:hypothetical protein